MRKTTLCLALLLAIVPLAATPSALADDPEGGSESEGSESSEWCIRSISTPPYYEIYWCGS